MIDNNKIAITTALAMGIQLIGGAFWIGGLSARVTILEQNNEGSEQLAADVAVVKNEMVHVNRTLVEIKDVLSEQKTNTPGKSRIR